jgi:hypothetical protein
MDQQLMYFKDFGDTVQHDHQTIIDMSNLMREFGEKTKDSIQEIAEKLDWASKLRAFQAVIRLLEFAATRLESSLDQTLVALQFTLSHRVPINILPPSLFRNILINVTLGLPEN